MKGEGRVLLALGTIVLSMAAAACNKSAAPAHSPVSETAVASVSPCTFDAALLGDVTVPGGTELSPHTAFPKTWRVRNSGTCDWWAGTQLVYISGAPLGNVRAVSVPTVKAGASVELSVNFIAPSQTGTYSAYWQMRRPDGNLFGAQMPVSIVVPAAPTAVPGADWSTVRFGDEGPNVFAIQYLLRAEGYTLEADGIFGPLTEGTISNFQTRKGLTSNGIVDPGTWTELIRYHMISSGAKGDDVRAVQYLLANVHGLAVKVDGIFGPATDSALRDFQASHGLMANGIVGPVTWKALVVGP
jgi:hypothetical protein